MPNLLIDMEHGPFNKHILVATNNIKINNTAENLEKVFAKKGAEVKIIIVDENSIKDVKRKIDDALSGFQDCEISFNFTGGTKQMAIGMYTLAEEKYKGAPLYYSHRNITWQNYSADDPAQKEYQKRLSIDTYFDSLGIKWSCGSKDDFIKTEEETDKFFEKYHEFIKSEFIEKLRKYRNEKRKSKKDYSYKLSGEDKSLLKSWNWPFNLNNSDILNKAEVNYLIGGWFEEWVYNHLQADDKKYSVKKNFDKDENRQENEMDVVGMRDNKFYMFECKTDITGIASETNYKSSALIKKFGSEDIACIVCLNDDYSDNNKKFKNLKGRGKVERVKILNPDDILNETWCK